MAPRKRAVLYVCTTSSGNAEAVLAELRTYARAHHWEVVAEHIDRTGAAPEEHRPAFRDVKAAIADGHADTLLTRYPAMAAYFPAERAALATWLGHHGATAHYTWKPTTVLSPSPEPAP